MPAFNRLIDQRIKKTNPIENPRGILAKQIVKRRLRTLPVQPTPFDTGAEAPPFAAPPPVYPTPIIQPSVPPFATTQPVVPLVSADANKQLQFQRLAQLKRSIGI